MAARPLIGVAAPAHGTDPLRRAPAEAPAGRPDFVPQGRDLDVDVLARTLYGEARGQGVRGLEAIAAVVLNRVAVAQANGGHWWGATVAEVCRKPWQFACWNPGDPNRAKLLAVDRDDPGFATCLRIARRACTGNLADPTGGATHYHRHDIEPAWAAGHSPVAAIGDHLFYADIAEG